MTKLKDFEDGYLDGYMDGQEDTEFLYQQAPTGVWQEVSVDPRGAGHTYRLPVSGGHLYRTVTYRYPELHKMWDEYRTQYNGDADLEIRKGEGWNDRDIIMAMEIVAQTVVFVKD